MNKLTTALIFCALSFNALAEDRALLIGVGKYQMKNADLPGIELDLGMMQEAAKLLGYNQIKTLQDEQATLATVEQTISTWLVDGMDKNDRVLIYYSGHGTNIPDRNNDETDQQDEALAMHDMFLRKNEISGVLVDDRFKELLRKIPSKHVWVLIDACHSGTATRSAGQAGIMGQNEFVPKFYRWEGMSDLKQSRGFSVTAKQDDAQTGIVTLSAAQDNEQSIATSNGSLFTVGLNRIIRQTAANHASLSPASMIEDVTTFLVNNLPGSTLFHPQISGDTNLLQQSTRVQTIDNGQGLMAQRLVDMIKTAQPLALQLNQRTFREGDKLISTVDIKQSGYLNIIEVNAQDEATVLYPNQFHLDNYVQADQFVLPTQQMDFELTAGAPFGRSFIVAILSPEKLNLYDNGFAQRGKDGNLSILFKSLTHKGLQQIAKVSKITKDNQSLLQAGVVETKVCTLDESC